MHKNRTFFFLLTFVLLTVPKMSASAGADISIVQEYEIKAAFIYNFAKFVEWPEEKFKDDTTPLILLDPPPMPFWAKPSEGDN